MIRMGCVLLAPVRRWPALAVALAAVCSAVIGCSVGGGGEGPPTLKIIRSGILVLFNNSVVGSLTFYPIRPLGGQLDPPLSEPMDQSPGAISAAETPDHNFVYIADSARDKIGAYSFDNSGTAFSVPGAPFTAGNGPIDVAIDPRERYLFCANELDGTVSSFTINATNGVLTPVVGSPFAAGKNTTALAISRDGKFAYAAHYFTSTQEIWEYSIDQSTGALAKIGAVDTDGQASQLLFDAAGHFLYAADLQVTVYSQNSSTGLLTKVQTVPIQVTGGSSAAALTPDGKFLYATSQRNAVISFSRDAVTGILTHIGVDVSTGASPSSVVVDPQGQFVYVGNKNGQSISGYQIDRSTGLLTPLTGFPLKQSGPVANLKMLVR